MTIARPAPIPRQERPGHIPRQERPSKERPLEVAFR